MQTEPHAPGRPTLHPCMSETDCGQISDAHSSRKNRRSLQRNIVLQHNSLTKANTNYYTSITKNRENMFQTVDTQIARKQCIGQTKMLLVGDQKRTWPITRFLDIISPSHDCNQRKLAVHTHQSDHKHIYNSKDIHHQNSSRTQAADQRTGHGPGNNR